MFDSVFENAAFLPVLQEQPLAREEENQIKARLWTLLVKQVRLQTQGDHSSIREEAAAELLQSLLFTLQVSLHHRGLSIRTLLQGDLAAMLKDGQHRLQHELNTAHTLYNIAMRTVNTFGSVSLTDTLAGIEQFFRLYDIALYAHVIPVSMDYPLCHPVADHLYGVLYIREYLERLLIENKLIGKYDAGQVVLLLQRISPDYRELLINLYKPAAANTIGLALLGAKQTNLEITKAEAAQIHEMISELPEASARKRLVSAAADSCKMLGITDAKSIVYLSREAETLYPRIRLTAAAGVFAAV